MLYAIHNTRKLIGNCALSLSSPVSKSARSSTHIPVALREDPLLPGPRRSALRIPSHNLWWRSGATNLLFIKSKEMSTTSKSPKEPSNSSAEKGVIGGDNSPFGSESNSIIYDPCFDRFAHHCLDKYGIHKSHLRSLVSLVEGGSTVPFIVRYRSEVVHNIETTAVFNINREISAFETVVKTRVSRLSKLESLGKLTPDLKRRFEAVFSMHDLDELWAPYKESKDSKISQILMVQGMSELVDRITRGELQILHRPLHMGTCKYSFEEALLFALSDAIAHDARTVSVVQQAMRRRSPTIASKLKTSIQDPKYDSNRCKYKDYHDMAPRPLNHMKNHQLLAMRRGQKEGILNISLDADSEGLKEISHRLHRIFRVTVDADGPAVDKIKKKSTKAKTASLTFPINRNVLFGLAIDDAINRIMAPVYCRASYRDALEAADEGALLVFRNNLKSLLLTPPLSSYVDSISADTSGKTKGSSGNRNVSSDSSSHSGSVRAVLSLDPGFAHGHKIAVIDFATNALLDTSKVFTKTSGRGDNIELSDCESACKELQRLQHIHGVDVIAIGDGVGSKTAQRLVELAVKHSYLPTSIVYAVVSEAGASVYSVSEVAKTEFPATEVSYLGGVSIARRLIHPLSELVKVEPASLGIGMYQHDLSSSVLNERLTEVIQECVNSGGVDVNTASAHLLQYVAGLNASRARAIVDHRMARGAFQSVSEVRSVKGIGDISFQNAAGFLRVFGGINPLDTTAVHPEHYELLLRLLGWADAKMATVTAVADDSNSVKSGTTKAKGKPKSRSFELVDASEIGSDRVKAICAFIINHQDEIPEEILSGVERNLDQGFTKLRKSVDETGGRGASKRKLAIDAIEDSNNNPTTKAKKIKTDVDVVSTSSMSQSNHNRDTAVSDCGEASEPKVSSLRSAALHTVTKWMDWMSRPISNAVHSSRSSSGVPRSANTGWISEDMRAGNPPTLIRFDATTREVVGRIGIIGQGSEPLGELIGRSFEGVVKNIVPFGVFVDIGASNSGLLHKSQFDAVGKSNHDGSRVGALKLRLSDIVIGQRIRVKVTGIKPVDRIELSLDI